MPSLFLLFMDDPHKRAYRWLLYRAMLDIRPIRWISTSWRDRINPLRWRYLFSRARSAGIVADWLHNLALFSALEFEHFDEERFWKDFDWFNNNYPWAGLSLYRDEFHRQLTSS